MNSRKPFYTAVENLFAIFVLSLLCWDLWHLYYNGFLPQPFFFEPSDTWMDWFNSAYWAHSPGAYDTWGTLYPPLSFVVLRVLGIGSCYVGSEGLTSRDCDWLGVLAIHGIYVINIFLIAFSYVKIDRSTAFPRSVALAAGMPMLYALERGNILLICFTCVLLGYGPLLRSTRWRWVFAGLAVNFKVYLIGPIVAQLLRRRWYWFERSMLASVLIYLVTFMIIGSGTPTQIIYNITDFSQGWRASSITDIWYSATYKPLISLLNGDFPVASIIGSKWVDVALVALQVMLYGSMCSIVLAAIATWLRPEVVPAHRVAFFGTAMALISSEAGGYTHILAMLFIFMERWRGIARPIAIVMCYLIALPGEWVLDSGLSLVRESFLGGEIVRVPVGFGIGMVLRPGLILVAVVALSAATLHDVWIDIRNNGWSQRWRYRHDLPIPADARKPVEPK